MPIDPELASRVAQALERQPVVTHEDLLQQYAAEITLTPDYVGYCNPRVTALIDALGSGHVAFLKFIQMQEDGYVIVLPAQSGEPGAVEIERAKSLRTCEVSLRLALLGFNLQFEADRKLRLPVEAADPIASSQGYLLIGVKRPGSDPRKQRVQAGVVAGTPADTGE